MDQDLMPLSPLAKEVVSALSAKEETPTEQTIQVNPFVSKVASWYEKMRNAMEYREEEVILRAAIERTLKRMLLLGGNAKTTAMPLVRELVWARYLPDNKVPVAIVDSVEESIDLYLRFRLKILSTNKISDRLVNEWIYQLLSADLAHILNSNKEEDILSGFMYQILKDYVQIADDSEETKNAQVFIAVRRAFAKDDVAFLRYHMFLQVFGRLTRQNVEAIAEEFGRGRREIEKQLHYPRKDKIFSFIRKNAPPFLILLDIFKNHSQSIESLLSNKSELEKVVVATCRRKYEGVSDKVRRAIVRSVFFILLTKVIFAFLVEGTYERIMFGKVLWRSMALNVGIPPLLMIVVGLFITTPSGSNTRKIFAYIQQILYQQHPKIGNTLVVKRKKDKNSPVLDAVFTFLWLLAFVVSFGAVVYMLSLLHFNIVSQGVFLFFLTIVSFLSYRISLTANVYRLEDRQNIFTPFIDFLFVPIIKVGSKLTQGISQINILLFLFDMLIETPFKVTFAFVEQWFYFLHSKREDLE